MTKILQRAINTDGTTFRVNNNCTIANGATLALTPAPSTYSPVTNDGGKTWMGGYRVERNALLKYIADHRIHNVVFLATDDHQNRINELFYSPTGQTDVQASYVKMPYCFEIVCGPLGASGPDLISNHSFSLAKKLADSIPNAQTAANLEPIGLAGYHGLHDVRRLGDPQADRLRQPADFYSRDTFNYNVLDVIADGKILTSQATALTRLCRMGLWNMTPSTTRRENCSDSRSRGIHDAVQNRNRVIDPTDRVICGAKNEVTRCVD